VLTVRKVQFKELEAIWVREYAESLLPVCREALPVETKELTNLDLTNRIVKALDGVAEFGIRHLRLLKPVALIAIASGPGFPLPWMMETLQDDNVLEDSKVDTLCGEFIEKAGGESPLVPYLSGK
jgi:hypothetical protein